MLYVISQMSNISNLTSTLLHLIPLQNLRNYSVLEQNHLTTKHPIFNQVISISSLLSASIYYTKFVVNKFNCQGKNTGTERKQIHRKCRSAEMIRKSCFIWSALSRRIRFCFHWLAVSMSNLFNMSFGNEEYSSGRLWTSVLRRMLGKNIHVLCRNG